MTLDPTLQAELIRQGWTPPPTRSSAARLIGDAEGAACLERAERDGDFNSEAAAQFMLKHLTKYERSTSELLVNFAKLAGHVPHDDRAFGPVIAGLARKKLIRQVGSCARERGNGTSGGRVWELVTPQNEAQVALHTNSL